MSDNVLALGDLQLQFPHSPTPKPEPESASLQSSQDSKEERLKEIRQALYQQRSIKRAKVAAWNITQKELNIKAEQGLATRNADISLFVGRLAFEVTEAQLQLFLEKFAPVVRAVVVKDNQGKSRGYGFVEFASKNDALKAWEQADGQILAERALIVDWERARTDKTFKPARLGGSLGHRSRLFTKKKLDLPPTAKQIAAAEASIKRRLEKEEAKAKLEEEKNKEVENKSVEQTAVTAVVDQADGSVSSSPTVQSPLDTDPNDSLSDKNVSRRTRSRKSRGKATSADIKRKRGNNASLAVRTQRRREGVSDNKPHNKRQKTSKPVALLGRDPLAAVADLGAIGNRCERATQRLMRDWKNLLREPLPGIVANPVGDNLFDWWVKIAPGGVWGEGVIHFRILFPRDRFPAKPPKVHVLSHLAHPNVVANNRVCLQILDQQADELHGPYSGWSSGIDLSGILVQLQAILLDTYWNAANVAHALTQIPAFPANFKTDNDDSKTTTVHLVCTASRYVDLEQKNVLQPRSVPQPIPITATAAGAGLVAMPRHLLVIQVLSFLGSDEAEAVGCCCRGLYAANQDDYLWRTLFNKRFQGDDSDVMGPIQDKSGSWRYMFLLQSRRVFTELRCFHTHKNFTEDLLGIPISFTRSATRLSSVSSSMDLLSREAFCVAKVRHTLWNDQFTQWLPLYFTPQHFTRALPYIQETFAQICKPKLNSKDFVSTFRPAMVLDVLPNLITTQVVLLMDEGITASAQVCQGFVLLHRLFLALCARFPELQAEVEVRIEAFLKNPRARCKKVAIARMDRETKMKAGSQLHPASLAALPSHSAVHVATTDNFHPAAFLGSKEWRSTINAASHNTSQQTEEESKEVMQDVEQDSQGEDDESKGHKESNQGPYSEGLASLGDFLPLLLVSRRYRWEDIAHVYLAEAFDRAVMWRLSRFPELKDIDGLITGEPSIEAFYKSSNFASSPFSSSTSSALEDEYNQAMKCEDDHARLRKSLQQNSLVSSMLIFLSSSGTKSFRRGVTSNGDLDQVAAQYDRFYGNPSPFLQAVFHKGVEFFQHLSSWTSYFEQLGLEVPRSRTLLSWLQQANISSQRKGYHSLEMDFAAIRGNQKSNVLLRGCSYPKIVFLIDVSGSMRATHQFGTRHVSRLDFVKEQLEQVLNHHVESHQQFLLVTFSTDAQPEKLKRGPAKFILASDNNIQIALTAAKRWAAGGRTDIMKALRCAYGFAGVSAIYLLSDGEAEFNVDEVSKLSRMRGVVVPCHPTALCANNKAQDMLAAIAQTTGGIFRNVSNLADLELPN